MNEHAEATYPRAILWNWQHHLNQLRLVAEGDSLIADIDARIAGLQAARARTVEKRDENAIDADVFRAAVAHWCAENDDAPLPPLPEPETREPGPYDVRAVPVTYRVDGRAWDLSAAYADDNGVVWRWSGTWERDDHGPYPLMTSDDGRNGVPFPELTPILHVTPIEVDPAATRPDVTEHAEEAKAS